MTDTECEALCARIDELCAEVERLRKQGARLFDKTLELGTENAKLRELVNDMRACFRIGAERDGVSKQWCYELFDSYTSKLRELGIEVDA